MTHLSEENIEDVTVLHIAGNLTLADLPAIEPRLNELADESGSRVVADIGGVEIITTPGIALLLKVARGVAMGGGMMAFASARADVRTVFTRCRLDTVLTLVDDVASGVKVVRGADA